MVKVYWPPLARLDATGMAKHCSTVYGCLLGAHPIEVFFIGFLWLQWLENVSNSSSHYSSKAVQSRTKMKTHFVDKDSKPVFSSSPAGRWARAACSIKKSVDVDGQFESVKFWILPILVELYSQKLDHKIWIFNSPCSLKRRRGNLLECRCYLIARTSVTLV